MAMTVEQTVVFKCSTPAEYTELLGKANAWLTERPTEAVSVVGAEAPREITLVTKPYPYEFDVRGPVLDSKG